MSTVPPNQLPSADLPSSTAVVVFSPEQTRAAWVELRDAQGTIVGYLARNGGTSHFFSPQEMEAIHRRAEKPPISGKTFAEIVESVRQKVEG